MHNKQFCLLHQFLNKAVSLLIVFIIVITLSGCSLPWNQKQISETTISATEDNADFTEYVNNLFADLLSADMVSLHAYVEHQRISELTIMRLLLAATTLTIPMTPQITPT